MKYLIECIGEYESKDPNSDNWFGYITSDESWLSKNKDDRSSCFVYFDLDDDCKFYQVGEGQCFYNTKEYKLTYWPKKRHILMDVTLEKESKLIFKKNGTITKLIDNPDVILKMLLE